MACEEVMRKILDGNWDKARLTEAETILTHLGQCESCRAAVTEYDHIRSILGATENFGDPAGGWIAFEERVGTCLKKGHSSQWISRVALAASILIAVVLGSLYWAPDRRPEGSGGPIQLSSVDIARQVAVFDQVSRVFEGKAGWVAVSDKTSDVGVLPAGVQARPQLLLLRLTISQKKTVVSQADLVIIPGQTAELEVPFLQDQQVKYRIGTTSGDRTSLTVWAEVQRPHQDGEVIAALATTLQVRPGEVRSAGQMVTSTGGYDLKIAFSKANHPEHKDKG